MFEKVTFRTYVNDHVVDPRRPTGGMMIRLMILEVALYVQRISGYFTRAVLIPEPRLIH